MNTIRFFLIMLIFTFLAGFYIVPTRAMPDHAVVFLDDETRTYLSPTCAPKDQKPRRTATAAEARRLKYEPDKQCQDASGFIQEGRSVAGNYLERLGMLPPLPSRWNPDGTWNW